jgi:two-component system, NarL family, nitrate/nitrite response regulator NarL
VNGVDIAGELGTIIISEHTLMRQGMKAFFADSRFRIRHEFNSVARATETPDVEANLVFIGARLDVEILAPLKSVRQAYPQSRIVFYAQRVQLPAEVLFEVFGSSLDACLMSDSSSEVLRQSLDLVMMGESVFPFSLLMGALPQEDELGRHLQSPAGQAFSDRERQVLNFLREGRSNKFIARELQLSEATVKVHIKTLLRKIGCMNRTQAAIWVTKHGLTEASQQPGGSAIAPESRATSVPLTPRDS